MSAKKSQKISEYGEAPKTINGRPFYSLNLDDDQKKFVNAINKGLRYVHNNSSENIANKIKGQFLDTNIEELTLIVNRYKEADSWYNSTYVNIDDYNRLQDIMIYGKTIDSKINSTDLVTNEFNK